eukprot:scpid48291/ scgid14498/ 
MSCMHSSMSKTHPLSARPRDVFVFFACITVCVRDAVFCATVPRNAIISLNLTKPVIAVAEQAKVEIQKQSETPTALPPSFHSLRPETATATIVNRALAKREKARHIHYDATDLMESIGLANPSAQAVLKHHHRQQRGASQRCGDCRVVTSADITAPMVGEGCVEQAPVRVPHCAGSCTSASWGYVDGRSSEMGYETWSSCCVPVQRNKTSVHFDYCDTTGQGKEYRTKEFDFVTECGCVPSPIFRVPISSFKPQYWPW